MLKLSQFFQIFHNSSHSAIFFLASNLRIYGLYAAQQREFTCNSNSMSSHIRISVNMQCSRQSSNDIFPHENLINGCRILSILNVIRGTQFILSVMRRKWEMHCGYSSDFGWLDTEQIPVPVNNQIFHYFSNWIIYLNVLPNLVQTFPLNYSPGTWQAWSINSSGGNLSS